MPRAADPSLFGNQLPVDYNPLNRIEFQNRKPDFDLDALLEQVTKFVEDFLFPVIENLTGVDLSVFLPLFDSLDMSSPEAFLQGLVDAILALGTALLGPNSPLNALNLFNLVPTDLLAHIPISNIGTALTNLIADPNFLDPESFSGLETWFHDPTGGHGGTGAAYTTADGTTKELLGNLIPVSAGQVLPIRGKAKWTGLAGTGNPIALAITGYSDTGATTQATIATHNTIPPTTDWVDLSGTYTVPDNVVSLRTRLVVGATATGGTVSFSKMAATKTGPLLQRLIAGTDPGTLLPDDITNLFTGIITNATALLNKAGLSDFNDLIATIGGDIGDDIAAVEERLNDFLHSLSPLNADHINTGNIADQFVPGVRTTIDNLVTQLFGFGGSQYSHTDSANALSHVSDTLAGLSSMVNRLQATITQGVQKQDEFERQASSLGADWHVTYPVGSGGTAAVDGHNAYFAKSGLNPRVFVARHIPLTTYGDEQVVRISLNSAAENPLLSGITGQPAYNDVLGRMSVDNLNFIRFRMGAGRAWLYRIINGIEQEMRAITYSSSDPGPGSMLTLICGQDGNARYFEGRHNANTVISVVETGVASMLGGAYRGAGFGGMANPWPLFFTQSAPGGVRLWSGGDQ